MNGYSRFIAPQVAACPHGTQCDNASSSFCEVPGCVIVNDVGEKLMVAGTGTDWLAGEQPDAVAVIVAAPIFTPVTCGCEDGAVAPAGMNTLAGLTRTVVALLLVNVSVTPPEGAGVPSLTGKGTVWPKGL